MTTAPTAVLDIPSITSDILATIDREREREIIARRFGLYGRKETLEEIGTVLGITRERVRQIEKQVLGKLRQLKHPHLEAMHAHFHAALEDLGRIVPLHELAAHLKTEHPAHINFLAHLLPGLVVITDNDNFHHSVAVAKHHDHKRLKQLDDDLVQTIKQIGEPTTLSVIAKQFEPILEEHHVHGLARSSKRINTLDDRWGLASWPEVNPKSIRDKVYIVLQRVHKPMHFSEIADAIKQSDFKRKDVTTQAIHNELIKDSRFVLVGRGIYALDKWGYSKGTVADVISGILRDQSPMHRDEIVKRVLKQRHVKPTTIILNLQGKEQFKRVAKATYALNA